MLHLPKQEKLFRTSCVREDQVQISMQTLSLHENTSILLTKYVYHAAKAQKKYETTLKNARMGINLTRDELSELNNLISPFIMKEQPSSHIFAVHADEIPVCRRTLYNYLDQRVFQARNIDLPRRVRYKKRKKSTTPRTSKTLQQVYQNKRTYIDFERFLECHPETEVVEMDTVKGSRTAGKCLLILPFSIDVCITSVLY